MLYSLVMLHGVVQKAGIQRVTLSSVHVHPSVIACNCIATRCKETIINIFMSFLYSGKFQTDMHLQLLMFIHLDITVDQGRSQGSTTWEYYYGKLHCPTLLYWDFL